MIGVKQAVQIAKEYFVDLMGFTNGEGILLEEVELSEDQGRPYWKVTLSTGNPSLPSAASGTFTRNRPVKDYKIFTIDAQTAEVRSMKIRELDASVLG